MQRVTEIQTAIQGITKHGQLVTKLYDAAVAAEHDVADDLYLCRSALLDAYRHLTKAHTDLQVDMAQRKLRDDRVADIASTLDGEVIASTSFELEPEPTVQTEAQRIAEQALRDDHAIA